MLKTDPVLNALVTVSTAKSQAFPCVLKANFNCFNEDLQAALGPWWGHVYYLLGRKYCCLHRRLLTESEGKPSTWRPNAVRTELRERRLQGPGRQASRAHQLPGWSVLFSFNSEVLL